MTCAFVCICTSVALQPSGNTDSCANTRAPVGSRARAAACCCCPDPVTAGKTEFAKSEPPLMRENTDPTHKASQSENRPAFPGNKDGNRATRLRWYKRVQRTEQSKGELNVHAHADRVLGFVWCVYVCARALSFQPAFVCLPRVHLCMCVAEPQWVSFHFSP